MKRSAALAALVVAVSSIAVGAPASAEHLSEGGELQTRWARHGFAEAWDLAVTDVDSDGNDEILYGGRKIALLDESSITSGQPRYTVKWNHDPANEVDAGDNTWTTGIKVIPDTGDLYVTTSDTDAYRIDAATGAKRWHNPTTGTWFSEGLAVFDAPGDDIPDLFPSGGTAALSGEDGSVLWNAATRRSTFAVTAELDESNGRDVIIATNPSGVAINQKTVWALNGSGEILWGFDPSSVVESLAAADVNGDGLDEAIVGTATGYVYAVGTGGVVRWANVPGFGRVESIAIANIDADDRPEVMVGYRTPSNDEPAFHVVAYDNTGVELWRHLIGQPIETLEVVQLDDDDRPELIAGAGVTNVLDTYGTAVALETGIDAVLREKWRVDTFEQVKSADAIVMEGRRLALIGSADSILRAVDAGTGEEVWTYAAGDYTFSTSAGDVDGDGVDEVAKSGDDGVVVLMDSRGDERWKRRTDVSNNGIVRGMDMGDADGDGDDEIAIGGTRFAGDDPGVVELYDGDGTLLWSNLLSGSSEDVAVADVTGDGVAEVIAGEAAGLDGECAVSAFDSATGERLWRTPISRCLVPVVDVGDVDSDGINEIVYGDRTLFAQPHLALLEGDGSIVWNRAITDQVFWVYALTDGIVHGGFTFGSIGAVTRRDPAGTQLWQATFPDDEEFGSGSRFATLAPRSSGGFDIAASADDGAVYLVDAADGTVRWGTRLEPQGLPHANRHPAGPIVFVPAQAGVDERLIVGQYRTGRRRAQAFALSMTGEIVGSTPMEGEAQAAALVRYDDGVFGAALGAGLAVYAFDACLGCAVNEAQPTTTTLSLTRDKGDIVATASLVDASGIGIAGETMTFFLNGDLVVEVPTDPTGRAIARFRRNEAKPGDVVRAAFAGDGTYGSSAAEQTVPQHFPPS